MMRQTVKSDSPMEFAKIAGTTLEVSRIGLGTWAMGGWMWGGTDERESIATIHAAIERGINLVDTAPAYGFGRSEEIVGRALGQGGLRRQVKIATKVGLEWKDGKVFRNAGRDRILREIDASLQRLRTDYIDIYQVHWPDPLVPVEQTAEAMRTLLEQGTIRAIDLAVRWILDQGASVALWGARHPAQIEPVNEIMGWSLDAASKSEIDRILRELVTDPIGPEFMAPPQRPTIDALPALL